MISIDGQPALPTGSPVPLGQCEWSTVYLMIIILVVLLP